MPKMKICYGVSVDAAIWAKAAGIRFGDMKAKKCALCGHSASPQDNFCGNCGKDLKAGMSIGVPELVELSMKKSPPPRPLTIMGCDDMICVCQLLAEGDGDILAWNRPPNLPLPGMDGLLREYLPRALDAEIRLFVIHERGPIKCTSTS